MPKKKQLHRLVTNYSATEVKKTEFVLQKKNYKSLFLYSYLLNNHALKLAQIFSHKATIQAEYPRTFLYIKINI